MGSQRSGEVSATVLRCYLSLGLWDAICTFQKGFYKDVRSGRGEQ